MLAVVPALAVCSGSSNRSSGTDPSAPDSVGPGHDWRQFGWDVGRSSASSAPTGITAANVGSMKRQQVALPGEVDGSAIYLSDVQVNGGAHDALFVTTTYGKTVAVDANTGSILWTFTPTHYSSWSGSAQIVNATPVADPDRQFIYAASPDGQIQKLGVADGHVAWSTLITQSPQSEKITSPLGYFGGRVIATTGGYIGDAPPYQGHVAVLDAGSGQLDHVWNALCSDQPSTMPAGHCDESGAAIWGRAGAAIDSSTGNIYVATGNGHWDGNTYWGDAVVELDSTATQMLGNYTPTNTDDLDRGDLDLGSSSPMLLGDGYLAQGGKDGQIRLVSVASMAGATPHKGGESQSVSSPGGAEVFSALAYMRSGSQPMLFAGDRNGTTAWTVSAGQLSAAWHNSHAATSPVVAGGMLFVYDPTGGGLHVYQPTSGSEVVTLPCGGGHWNSPIIADGRIVLPEGSANDHQAKGTLDIWRLP